MRPCGRAQANLLLVLFRFGARLPECLRAADLLAARGFSTTVADARFAKPLDMDLILRLAREHEALITVEEGSVGGFGAFVLHALAERGPNPSRAEVDAAVREGALQRVRPKAMTVAVILAGLAPILIGHGAGSEVMSRIAAPMIGGMLSAPLL